MKKVTIDMQNFINNHPTANYNPLGYMGATPPTPRDSNKMSSPVDLELVKDELEKLLKLNAKKQRTDGATSGI